jgi:hypothetical protein
MKKLNSLDAKEIGDGLGVNWKEVQHRVHCLRFTVFSNYKVITYES